MVEEAKEERGQKREISQREEAEVNGKRNVKQKTSSKREELDPLESGEEGEEVVAGVLGSAQGCHDLAVGRGVNRH